MTHTLSRLKRDWPSGHAVIGNNAIRPCYPSLLLAYAIFFQATRCKSNIFFSAPKYRRCWRSRSPDSRSDEAADVQPLSIYLVDAKLAPETVEEIQQLVDQFPDRGLYLCPSAKDADVVVTNIHMRQRLQRHIDWTTAKQKAIVTPKWLRDSVESKQLLPCGDYAALAELYQETVHNCPDNDCTHQHQHHSPTLVGHEHPPAKVKASNISHNHSHACMRFSPLICPNQELVEKLATLRRHRELEGMEMQALSYDRAISVLKAFPHRITLDNITNVFELSHIGGKIFSKIQEFIQDGDVSECKDILSDIRYQSLVSFTTIHGIGPTTARKLYSHGLRTLQDLDKYYGVTARDSRDDLNSQRFYTKMQATLPDLSIKVALALREELRMQIPRSEVEEIHDVVMNELWKIRSGYRRGKPYSNDIDIVISHEDIKSGENQVKGLCTDLVRQLVDKGLVTHITHLSSFREHNTLRTSHWDSLEKALTVIKLPDTAGGDEQHKHVHRRLDLIFAAPEVYWTAVVGWTGSKMFERDLRLWAKQEKWVGSIPSTPVHGLTSSGRGMRFDSSGMQVP
ncbi:hypothetical protein D9757_000510 [Collybiopsis confluens]|uniref:BRCT domain-containing protein n=1 Tax=Collybiopsis confluens TaxID=2823264 RepID=A0A8H5I1C8_9AGAR|nr:hypothetical protein D9757_000510 [Collybiopsis confluens]